MEADFSCPIALANAMFALSDLTPWTPPPPKKFNSLVQGLNARERSTLRAFAEAGRACMQVLTEATIQGLRRVDASGARMSIKSMPSMPELQNSSSGSGTEFFAKRQSRLKVGDFFRQFDTDNDGFLNKAEFMEAFASLGNSSVSEKLWENGDMNWKLADSDGNGKVDVNEFISWITTHQSGGAMRPSTPADTIESLRKLVVAYEADLLNMERRRLARETQFEEEIAASLSFWRSIAASSANAKALQDYMDLDQVTWLGSGNYAHVFKSRRRKDSKFVVVKLMSVRWAHVAVKEWQCGSAIGHHDHIVDHVDVIMHGDDDHAIERLLRDGYESGALVAKKRPPTKFPDRFLALIQEYMNRGTLQSWLDSELLLPGGMLVTLQQVANALAFMHAKGLTHNDIKPENILLNQEEGGPRSKVTVKLADLGLAKKSPETSIDHQQYGMTLFCMITGERYGARKYKAETTGELVEVATKTINSTDDGDNLGRAFAELPAILQETFTVAANMRVISQKKCLQGWTFWDGELIEEAPVVVSIPMVETCSELNRSARSCARKRTIVPHLLRSQASSLEHYLDDIGQNVDDDEDDDADDSD